LAFWSSSPDNHASKSDDRPNVFTRLSVSEWILLCKPAPHSAILEVGPSYREAKGGAFDFFQHKHSVRTITDFQPSIADHGDDLYVRPEVCPSPQETARALPQTISALFEKMIFDPKTGLDTLYPTSKAHRAQEIL
jgi:hypothetical protein